MKLPTKPAPWSVEPERMALLIIDMQKDFCSPGGYVDAMGYDLTPVRKPIEPLQRVLEAVRGTDILTIFTRFGKRPDLTDEPAHHSGRFAASRASGFPNSAVYGDEGPLGRLCIRGDEGWQIVEELLPVEGEPIVEKPTKSSFRSTDLELILRAQGRDQLLISGVTTDVCVMTTMRDGNDLGFECCLLTDCAASPDEQVHRNTVDQLSMQGGIFGWWTTSDGLTGALRDAGVTPRATSFTVKDPAGYW
jgi:nicotinamidase-related amidase